MKLGAALLVFLTFFSSVGLAQEKPLDGNPVTVKKTTDFELTGDGKNSSWESTQWVNMTQRKQLGAPGETKFKVLYSEKGIYFYSTTKTQV